MKPSKKPAKSKRNLKQIDVAPHTKGILIELASYLKPPEPLSLSEFAEKNLYIPQNSAEPGRWKARRAPFQKFMLDAISTPGVREVTFMTSSQIGKTTVLLFAMAYCIAHLGYPLLYVLPTNNEHDAFAREKWRPFVQDNPLLLELIGDPEKKTSGCTLSHYPFPGGFAELVGAESAKGLAMRSVGRVIFDETERMTRDVAGEGDPIQLGKNRAESFWDKQFIYASTPLEEMLGRINILYQQGSMHEWCHPCPSCEEWQPFEFDRFDTQTCYMACRECGSAHSEGEWKATVGRAIPLQPEITDHISFHINRFSGLTTTWQDMAIAYRLAEQKGEAGLRGYWNTYLGLPYEAAGERVEPEQLLARVEDYGPVLPARVLLLTAGVDIQIDRLELGLMGWGLGEEGWSFGQKVFWGDPLMPEVWKELDEYLDRSFQHESGKVLGIYATLIDAAGQPGASQTAYEFCRTRASRRIFAGKGASTPFAPILSTAQDKKYGTKKQRPIRLYMVGDYEGKANIYGRLKIQEPGPGYIHFSKQYCDEEYFAQLTAEKLVVETDKKGYDKKVWKNIRSNKRNEALDCMKLAYAAIKTGNFSWQKLSRLLAMPDKPEPTPETSPPPVEKPAQASTEIKTENVKKAPRRKVVRRSRSRGLANW